MFHVILLLHCIKWPNFITWLPLLCEMSGNISILINCLLRALWHKFEINLISLIKSLFIHDQIVEAKTCISGGQIELLRWNKRQFSSFLKDIHWRNKNISFSKGENPTLRKKKFKMGVSHRVVMGIFFKEDMGDIFSEWR